MVKKISNMIDWYTFWNIFFCFILFDIGLIILIFLDVRNNYHFVWIGLCISIIPLTFFIICFVNRRKIVFDNNRLDTTKDHFYRQEKRIVDLCQIISIELTGKWDENHKKYNGIFRKEHRTVINFLFGGLWSNHYWLKARTSFFLRNQNGELFILHNEGFNIKHLKIIEKTILSINPNIKVIISVDDLFGKNKKGPDSQSKFPFK